MTPRTLRNLKCITRLVVLSLVSIAMWPHRSVASPENDRDLIRAVIAGNIADAKAALSRGSDVNAVDRVGNTALSYAAAFGYKDIAALLLNDGADPNFRTAHWDLYGNRRSVVDLALQFDYPEVAAMIYASSVSKRLRGLSSQSGKAQELIQAIISKRQTTVLRLLDHGVDPNCIDTSGTWRGWWALDIAVESDNLQMVRLLVSKGANVDLANREGQTAIMVAIRNNLGPQILSYLLARHANVEARDGYGNTPLTLAALASRPQVDQLLKYHADPFARSEGGNQTPYEIALAAGNRQSALALLRAMNRIRQHHPRSAKVPTAAKTNSRHGH